MDVDGSSHLPADSYPRSVGLAWGLAASRCLVCIRQINRVNSRNDDRTINIIMMLLLGRIELLYESRRGLLLLTEQRGMSIYSMSVCHTSGPWKSGWIDRDAVWIQESGVPGPHPYGKVQYFKGEGRLVVKYSESLPWSVQNARTNRTAFSVTDSIQLNSTQLNEL